MSKRQKKTRRRVASSPPAPRPEATPEPAPTLPEPIIGPKYLQAARSLMLALLALGLAWRFVGLKWDGGFHLHPDERFLTMLVPELRLPSSLADWFATASSGFNPWVARPETGLFVYGQLPLLIGKLAAVRLGSDSYDGVLLVGRALSAAFDAGTVLLVWAVGRRLLGRDAGLVAAILLAFTALHIQLAHFYTVDSFASFFLALSFWALLKWLDFGRARWALASGAAWGFAVACKISALLFAPTFALALAIALGRILAQKKRAGALEEHASGLQVLAGVVAVAAGLACAFRLGHPMAFAGEAGPLGGFFDLRPAHGVTVTGVDKTFWSSVAEQAAITNGDADVPFSWQFFGRKDIVWPLRNLLVWGVGWQAMLPAIIALAWIPWRVFKRREESAWLLVAAWAAIGFAANAVQFSKFSRYLLVITPFVALLAAWLLQRLWRLALDERLKYLQDGGGAAWRENLPVGAAAIAGAALGGTVCWGSAVASIYTIPHTRVRASEFLGAQPVGTTIANESDWDDALPLSGQERFGMLKLNLVGREDEAWCENLISTLERADWLVVSSQRQWGSIPRLPKRYPLTTLYYKALFAGQMGLLPAREFTSYPELNLFGWKIAFPDDNCEEALTVYDHPRVVLWQKSASWSRQNAESLLPLSALGERDDSPLKELIAAGAHVDEDALPWMPSPPPAAR